MKSYSSTEILRILRKNGWVIKNQEGSHVQLKHPTKPGKVTVPHPRKDLDPKTVRSIFRQAQISMEE
ncbi:type II toxin-antitoxin system HicA family toxin [Desulfofundulus sp. TPOSR]|uniref:type II toxin-antitoxin system HicA family toxin n=1 Tax=Desulfofundulus sp. TPOSR TaxID=2714340 RepID=UPI0014074E50|nr:type II toxin-antitoxin system HicA family toxin [Desulfofundulus sp. TPOSR]NHM28039.1 type II toxin-antitoxin system HicA family toxin [Desulfofundulus sp. TPOSR]